MSAGGFTLAQSIDVAALAERFARDRRVQIAPLIDPDQAEALAAHLLARPDWRQVRNNGERIFESVPALLARLTDEQRRRLDDSAYAGARLGFQYRYQSIRVPDDPAARAAIDDPLGAFARFMASAPVLALLRQIGVAPDIDATDAQATLYRNGDFLTAHSDAVAGRHRRAAYVFGLTRDWQVDWGGLLLFHDGAAVAGFVPGFNSLSLFAVPQLHSVSQVTPWAAGDRLAVTGWLRAADPA